MSYSKIKPPVLTEIYGNSYNEWYDKIKRKLFEEKLWDVVEKGIEKPKLEDGGDDGGVVQVLMFQSELSDWKEECKKDKLAFSIIKNSINTFMLRGLKIEHVKSSKELFEVIKNAYGVDAKPISIFASVVDAAGKIEGHDSYLDYEKKINIAEEVIKKDLDGETRLLCEKIFNAFKMGAEINSLIHDNQYELVDKLLQKKLDEYDEFINLVNSKLALGTVDDPIQINYLEEVNAVKETVRNVVEGCTNCGKSSHLAKNCFRKCTSCDSVGHYTKNCNVKFSINKESSTYNCVNSIFIIDSGASKHVSIYPGVVYNPSDKSIKLTDGKIYKVEYETNIQIGNLNLKNVLFCPQLQSNIISVSELAKSGYTIIFKNNVCIIKFNNKEIYNITEKNGIYCIEITNESINNIDTVIHQRFGHLSDSQISKFKNIVGDKISKLKKFDKINCDTCQQANFKKKTIKGNRPSTKTSSPLQLIHMDLWSAPILSKNGFKYIATYTDDFTRYSSIYELKRKSDQVKKFILFKNFAENKLNKTIKAIQVDNGGEYISNEFKEICDEFGIEIHYAPPYTPELNGVAERLNQTLITKVRAMKTQSGVPWKYWVEMIRTANTIRNSLPTQKLQNTTPYIMWNGKHPYYDVFKTFGCLAIVRNIRKNNKFDIQGFKGVLVGYNTELTAYQILEPDTGKVYTRKDVYFDESIFPLKNKNENENDIEFDLINEIMNNDENINDGVYSNLLPKIKEKEKKKRRGKRTKKVKKEPTGQYDEVKDEENNNEIKDETIEDDSDNSSIGEESNDNSKEESEESELESEEDLNSNDNSKEESGESEEESEEDKEPISKYRETKQIEEAAKNRNQFGLRKLRNRVINNTTEKDRLRTKRRSLSFTSSTEYQNYNLNETENTQDINNIKIIASDVIEPKSIIEVNLSKYKDKWYTAMKDEENSFDNMNVFDLVKLDKTNFDKQIGCKWVFTTKSDSQGIVSRFKARLVAKGYNQVKGVDYDETFAPVARIATVRLLVSTALTKGHVIHQMDVKTAFLYGDIDKDVFVTCPQEFSCYKEGYCMKLNKSLYGLKQAPKIWYENLRDSLIEYGFTETNSSPCLFSKNNVFVLLYVDDILISGELHKVNEVKEFLSTKYQIADLGEIRQFLNITFTKIENGYIMTQTKQINEILKDYQMENCNGKYTPILNTKEDPNSKLLNEEYKKKYEEGLGRLQYISRHTRPDIAFAVHKLYRHLKHTTEQDLERFKGVLHYLKKTKYEGIKITSNANSEPTRCYVDANFTPDRGDGVCTSGVIIYHHNNPVVWLSCKQKITNKKDEEGEKAALSTMEAEYYALVEGTKRVLWTRNMLEELSPNALKSITPIYEDNESCIKFAKGNASMHTNAMHIRRQSFIRIEVKHGNIRIEGIATNENIADIFTKPLGKIKFTEHKLKLCTVNEKAEEVDKLRIQEIE